MKRLFGLLLLLTNLDPVWGGTNDTQTTDVAFTATSDGTAQPYVLRMPVSFQPGQTHDLLIALHGHGSDRWQFVHDPRDVFLIQREEGGHATNCNDGRAIIEFVIQKGKL